MCDERNETVMHIFSECSKLAQTEYRKRHAKVTTIVHWQLCCKYGFEPAKHCYEHRAEVMVMETQDTKILWDFSIRTVRVIDARHPDVVLIIRIRKRSSLICLYLGISVSATRRLKRYRYTKIWH